MQHWSKEALFYHIYPMGFCETPRFNDFTSEPVPRINRIKEWVQPMKDLGVNALYLGPIFESTEHGYDTADYYTVDRRLGTNNDVKEVINDLQQQGIRVILDGVFNHVGRDFWAFKDVQQHREGSIFCGWFHHLDFGGNTPYNDHFHYEPWEGHYNLIKLNLSNSYVREHLFNAVKQWIEEFNIDGLRLDVAYCIDIGFLQELSRFCKSIKPDFWIVGECLFGDYRRWMNSETLDSVTNFEIYKGLYSSFNDKNMFEVAASLNRQFADEYGLYAYQPTYNFADNHDVNRTASLLHNKAHLYPLYALLMTIPGIPSIYYGSEYGMEGMKSDTDAPLRPSIDEVLNPDNQKHKDLYHAIKRFGHIRANSDALKNGGYKQVGITSEQFAFVRQSQQETYVVAVNASEHQADMALYNLYCGGYKLIDVLNDNAEFDLQGDRAFINVPANWARIMKVV